MSLASECDTNHRRSEADYIEVTSKRLEADAKGQEKDSLTVGHASESSASPGGTTSNWHGSSKDLSEPPVLNSAYDKDGFPDGGFKAWSVIFGSFLMVFTTFGYTNAFGVYQSYLKQNQLASSSESAISWIGSLQIFLSFSGGLISGRIFDSHGKYMVRCL